MRQAVLSMNGGLGIFYWKSVFAGLLYMTFNDEKDLRRNSNSRWSEENKNRLYNFFVAILTSTAFVDGSGYLKRKEVPSLQYKWYRSQT